MQSLQLPLNASHKKYKKGKNKKDLARNFDSN